MERHENDPLTPEELAEQHAEELPAREVLTTLPLELWGTPGAVAADETPLDVETPHDESDSAA